MTLKLSREYLVLRVLTAFSVVSCFASVRMVAPAAIFSVICAYRSWKDGASLEPLLLSVLNFLAALIIVVAIDDPSSGAVMNLMLVIIAGVALLIDLVWMATRRFRP